MASAFRRVVIGLVNTLVVAIFYKILASTFPVSPAILPIIVGTATSFMVGFFWYSSLLFGRVWWGLQFPEKKYGECGGPMFIPLAVTLTALAIQNTMVSYIMNAIQHHRSAFPLGIITTWQLPLLCASSLIIVVGCASLPHYLFSGKHVALFAIGFGHDTVQIMLGTFTVYMVM